MYIGCVIFLGNAGNVTNYRILEGHSVLLICITCFMYVDQCGELNHCFAMKYFVK